MDSIKRGVYRLADVLALTGEDGLVWYGEFDFTIQGTIMGQEVTAHCDRMAVYVDGVTYRIVSTSPDLGIPSGETGWAFTPDGWHVEEFGEHLQTITVLEEQFVSEEFAAWFSDHVVMTHMPGKTGVTIEWDGSTEGRLHFPHPLDPDNIVLCQVSDRAFTPRELSEWAFWYDDREHYPASWSTYEKWDRICTDIYNEHLYYLKEVYVVTSDFSLGGMTIPTGVYFPLVYEENGDVRYIRRLILQNANETADEPPQTCVTYNGEVIASLFGGQTATLKCAGMTMESDVVVEMKGEGLLV